VDDVRAFESLPIDIWLEEQRVGVCLSYLGIQLAVDRDVKCLAAVSTLGLEFNGKLLSSEAPLHEGRSERVFRSSAMSAFSRTELQAMRRGLAGDGKCPADFARAVSNQEEEMAFQVFHNVVNLRDRQAEGGCHTIHFYWISVFIRQFANREVPNQMMFRRHESEPSREAFREFGHGGLELGVGDPSYLLTAAD